MKQVPRFAAVIGTLAVMALGAPLAGADTTWTKISTDYNANIAIPSLGLTGSTAVVAWTQETGPLTSDLNAVAFTHLADAGRDRRREHQGAGELGADRLHACALPGSGRRPAADLQRHPLDHDRGPAERHGDDAPQPRRQLGRAVRRLVVELRPDDRRALGRDPARRGLCHAGHRDLQRVRGPRAGGVGPEPAAPARRLLRLRPADGARQRRPSLDRVVLERDGGDGHVPATARSRDRRADGRARTGPQQREQQQQQLRRGPRLRGDLPPRLRQLAGRRPRRHDRLLVARWGTRHDRQPGRHRTGCRARHRQRLPRGRAPLDRLVRRQDVPRDARRFHGRRRRGAGCGRAQGLAEQRLCAQRHRRGGQPPAGCELRLERDRRRFRSRSS